MTPGLKLVERAFLTRGVPVLPAALSNTNEGTHMSEEQKTAIQRVTRQRLAIRERQRQALELRLSGLTFQGIADALGYKSKHGSFRAVETALAEITREPAESLRTMELQRLDGMFAGFWPKAQQGDPVAA